MSKNWKGLLNELTQKQRLKAPEYGTIKVGGDDHCPTFKSICRVGFINRSGQGTNKKEAEQNAAYNVYECFALGKLGGMGESELVDINESSSNEKTEYEDEKVIANKKDIEEVVIIDGENLPKVIDTIPYNDKRQIIIYFSKNHHLVGYKEPKYVIKRISPCTRIDGCDIYMAMDTMTIKEEFPNAKKIIIMSRDKFASAVADNFPSFFSGINVTHKVSW